MKTGSVGLFPVAAAATLIVFLSAMSVGHAGGKVAAWGNNSYGQCVLPNGLKGVKAIAGGGAHSLALKADGTVVAWGRNTEGQTNVPAGLSGVVAVAAGGQHSLALKADGSVVAWGYRYYGVTNVPVGLSGVRAIAAGDLHSLALRADGTVAFWGSYYEGLDIINTNLPPGLSNVIAVAAGSSHSLALKADGTVVAWGWNSAGQTNVPTGLSNVVAVEAGLYHSVALKADGTVVVWGDGSYGQTNVPPGLSEVTAIGAGADTCLALKSDGSLVLWGGGIYGATNLPAALTNVTAIACGGTHHLALVHDGPPEIIEQPADIGVAYQSNLVLSVVASGIEPLSYRWLFNGVALTNSDRVTGAIAASLILSNVQFTDNGSYLVIVSNAFGLVQSTGAVLTVISPPFITAQSSNQTVPVGSDLALSVSASGTPPLVYQWLFNGTKLTTHVTATFSVTAALALTNVQPAASGTYSLFVSNAYGSTQGDILLTVTDSAPYILTQPAGQSVQLGGVANFSVNARGSTPMTLQWKFNGTDIVGATNTTLTLASLRYDQAGFYTVAISNAFGSVVSAKAQLTVRQVAVWGTTFSYVPTNIPAGLTNLIAIAAGGDYLLGLRVDGTVAVIPSVLVRSLVPTNLPAGLSDVTAIAAGASHCLALKSNGTVVAWGRSAGFFPPPYFPPDPATNVPAGLSNVVAIAAGGSHSLALKSDGKVVAWGNYSGYYGGSFEPVPVVKSATNVPAGLSNVIAIAADGAQSLALKSDGKVVSWGVTTNVPNNLSNVIAIACADGYNLALQTSGKVVAWPTLPTYPVPFPRPGFYPINTNVPATLSNVVAIAAGGYGMALKSDGSVSAWGSSVPQTPAGLSNAFAIATGSSFLAALVGDGSPRFTLQPASQTVAKGASVRFHARAVGVPPLSYQWQLNGANLPGATNSDLTVTNSQGKDTGGYRAVVANSLGALASVTATLTIPFSTNLASALNATNLVWTFTTTNAPWFAQIQETHDGDVAAQSGHITDNQQSILQTTVIGPGTMTFWWKVSSEEGYDRLSFSLDAAAIAEISGEVDWQQIVLPVPAGSHTVRWGYSKDVNVSAGRDAGWLDEVVFTPAPLITLQPLDQTVWGGSEVLFHAAANGAGIAFYQWLKNGTNLPGAFGSLLTLTNVTRRDSGTYALRVTNPGGSVLSSNATLLVRVPQYLSAPLRFSDGTFVFRSGDADGGVLSPENLDAFEVQATTNLHDWITLTNACALTNGSLLLHDPDGNNHPVRFYRVIEH